MLAHDHDDIAERRELDAAVDAQDDEVCPWCGVAFDDHGPDRMTAGMAWAQCARAAASVEAVELRTWTRDRYRRELAAWQERPCRAPRG